MLIKDLKNCREFTAGDGSKLRELLHPDKENVRIRYSLAHATVRPGQKTLPHKLSTAEVYYITEGVGVMHINGESAAVGPGQAIYIPPHSIQFLHNTGKHPVKFICIVDPAWRKEDEEIILD